MIALVCSSEAHRFAVRAGIPAAMPVFCVSDVRWLGTLSECRVVVLGPVTAEQSEALARHFQTIGPHQRPVPVVLVCDGSAPSLRFATQVRPDSVIQMEEIPRALWREVARARAAHVLRRAETELVTDSIPRSLREALRYALRADRPPRGVKELATTIGCHRTTLSKEWRAATDRRSPLAFRLEDFLGWLGLVHAAALYRPEKNWAWVAGQLGVHRETLRRASKRLAGVGLSDVGVTLGEVVLDRFCTMVDQARARPTSGGGSRHLVG
jgi:hypothetical protein